MARRAICRVGLLLAGLVLAGTALAATEPRKVALVIGNSTYREAPLKNPQNDARAMAAALKERGFEVILRQNASKTDMERAVADFGEKLEEGATGLFYYAGHGMQVNGRNFLIPVDAQITSEQRVRLETLDVDVVLDQMQAAKSKVSLVILDACRNNPFERRFRSTGGGLAQINAPEGTLISYATAPGKVAADGEGENSLFTEELLRAVKQPGLKVEEVFKAVRIGVTRRSNGAQTPWEASSLVGDFYFVPPPPPPVQVAAVAPVVAPPPPPPVVVAPAPQPQSLDLAFWDAVKGSNSPAELQAYLESFPNGTFAPLAKARIAALSRAAAAPPPATAPAPVAAAPAAKPAAPAPAAPPTQQAALAPAPVATSAAFDGAYRAFYTASGGNSVQSTLGVTNGQLTGWLHSSISRASRSTDFGVVSCSVTGLVDSGGRVQNGLATRGTSTYPVSGHFQASGGDINATIEVLADILVRTAKPEWRRTSTTAPASVRSVDPAPAPSAPPPSSQPVPECRTRGC